MCGLPCWKAAMDGRARADAAVSKVMANLKQVLDCLQTTASAEPTLSFTHEMESKMVEAAGRYRDAVSAAAEAYAAVAIALEKEAREKWPPTTSA